MNRPKVDDYYNYSINEYNIYSYITDLNEYCNSLEKALDKACTRLEFASKVINEFNGYTDDKYDHKDKWKKWSMKDE